MRLFLDTEFNGFGGELISLALVSDDGDEWYRVKHIPDNPHPWVKEHVLPRLAIGPYSGLVMPGFMESFSLFMHRYRGSTIMADWPADIEHICNLLSWDGSQNGWRVPGEYTFALIEREGDYVSEIEHNALSDARALRDYCNDWWGKKK